MKYKSLKTFSKSSIRDLKMPVKLENFDLPKFEINNS